jgi:polysaccharide pyruvyl transferase WcaK-like protein/O-antigen/teichoic acid export membrane protein
MRQHISLIVRIKLILWLIVSIIFVWQIERIELTLIGLGLIAILLESLSTTLLQALRACNQHRIVALIQLIAPGMLLAVVSWWYPDDIHMLFSIQIVSLIIVLITAWNQLRPHIHRNPITSTTIHIIRSSGPFIFSDLLAQIYTYTSTLLLASYASATDVGIFRGAWSFIAYTVVIPSIIFSTTLPLLNNANQSLRKSIIQRSAISFVAYAVSMGTFVALGGGQIITILYGESFAPSVTFITHLTILPFIKALTFFGVMLIIHRQRLVWRIIVQLITVGVLWLSMPPLIATAGISGAIYAQLITESVLALGYLLGGIWNTRTKPATPPTWPPRRIVITNMYGTRNLGDAAIHHHQYMWLNHQFPHAHIQRCYAVAPTPDTIPSISHWVYDQHGQIAPWLTRLRRMLALIWSIVMHLLGITTTWGMNSAERNTFTTITTADLVCTSGGGYLYDLPSPRPWWRLISWDIWICTDMIIAIIWHRPLVLMPQSIGPLYNRPFRILVQSILRRAHVVYVRESYSAHLLDTLGVAYQQAPDFVWNLSSTSPPVQHLTPTLGITLIDWGIQSHQPTLQQAYESAIITVAQHYHAHGWHIQLFGQCTDQTPGWDDSVVVQRIALQLPFATVMPTVDTPTALQYQYAQLTCLLSTRLHGALMRFAMMQSAVVIAYQPKAIGIMYDAGLAAWCITIDTITPEAIIAAIDSHHDQLSIIAVQRQQSTTQLAQLTIPSTTDQES